MPDIVSVVVRGDLAIFTRPELKVERLSYPIMTPSAARGVLDAILFKPQMYWHVRRIVALRPRFPLGFPVAESNRSYRLIGVRRNEIQGKIAATSIKGWEADPKSFEPYLVDSAGRESAGGQNRTQRNSLLLHHVAYRIEATPKLTVRANLPRTKSPDADEEPGTDSVTKYVAMFNRRVAKGQCFHRPYLGCREFAAEFAPPSERDVVLSDWNEAMGLMLYDIRFGADGTNRPGFFHAEVKSGVLHCDTEAASPDGRAPVRVFGWDAEGGAA